MKALRIFVTGFILAGITFSFTLPAVKAQDYYSQDEQNKAILKDAVVGAGVGAVSAGASGGSAGKGALIGAGTNVIGSAVLDTLTNSSTPQYQQQYQPQVQYAQPVETAYAPVESAPRRGGCGRK